MTSAFFEKTTLEKIKLLIRATSASAMEAMAQKSGVVVEEISGNQKILGHWMSLISISGDQLHITFKAQFSIAMARTFAEHALQINPDKISNSHSKDFVREFCNLLAGQIKNKFSENNVVVGISLPLLSRGFDDLYFSSSDLSGRSFDRWKLSYQGTDIFCLSDTEVVDELILNDNFNQITSTSGDVEFF